MAIALLILVLILTALTWREIGPAIFSSLASPSPSDDGVDERSMESFPCSDPPPWTLGVEPRANP